MSATLNLAVVGCGAISQLHLPALREGARRTTIAAVVDTDPARAEAAARSTGATPFTSLDAALARGGIEAVDLLLPHHLHEAVAVRCLDAGLHVLLEKPMATTLPACERILAAARRAGTVFMVGENTQYWPEVLTAQRLLGEGAIGDVVTARGSFAIPPLPQFYGEPNAWRLDNAVAGGGIALDTGSHWIRPLRMWLGEVDAVVGAIGRPYAAMQGESLVRALLRFRSGVVAALDGIMREPPFAPEPLFRLTGTRGEITVERAGYAQLWSPEEPTGREVGELGGYPSSFPAQFADFEAAVLDGTPLAAGPEAALGELRVALALYRSVESGRWEPVWD
ncbi:Gfo/Idh/MocA family oxidoreductase [bacterium]|nr:Gfo/Idh/MocA family oxidoreductase [bacterium]